MAVRRHTGLPPATAIISLKTHAVLQMAESRENPELWESLYIQAVGVYSAKAVKRKAHELEERGYLEVPSVLAPPYPLDAFTLTDRGRTVLELCRYQASLKATA